MPETGALITELFELLGVIDGEAPLESDDVGDAVIVEEVVGEPDIDDVDVDSAVAVALALIVELGVPVAEGVDDAVTLDEGEGVAGALALLLGLAPDERDDVGDAVRVEVSDCVDDGDTDDVGVGVIVEVGDVEDVGVGALEVEGSPLAEALTDGLGVSLGVREGLAPFERGGVVEAVLLAVRVADDELLTVLLLVRLGVSEVEGLEDGVCVPVGDPVVLVEAVRLEESDTLGVMEAEAPTVTDAVGVREFDAASVSVLEGVANADPEGVGDGLPVPETVGVILDVIEDESEMVPELEGLAPLVRLAVGDLDCVLERLCVELAVEDDVGVPEVVLEPEPVCEGVTGEVDEAVSETLDEGDEDSDGDGVPLAEPPYDKVVVGVAVTVEDTLNVDDPLSLPDGVCVGVQEPDPVPELVGELVDVAVEVTVAVTLAESDTLGVMDGLAPDDTEGVAEFDSDELSVDVEDGVHDDVPVREEVPDPVPVCVGVGGEVEEAVDDALDVGDEDSDRVGVPLAEPPID